MRVLAVLALLTLTFFSLSGLCYADPVVPVHSWLWSASVIMLVGTAIFETIIVYHLAKRKLQSSTTPQGNTLYGLHVPVIFINLGTFVATQALAYGLMKLSGNDRIGYLAEILPLVAEYILLRWLFMKLYLKGMFKEPFSYMFIEQLA